MVHFQTIKLRLSKGIRIPYWMTNLKNTEIGYERINGKRIRFVKFRRAEFLSFGREGSIWLILSECRAGFRFFPNTLQVLNARGKVIAQNYFLCSECFTLSGKLLGLPVSVEGSSSRVKGQFACASNGCVEKWESEW